MHCCPALRALSLPHTAPPPLPCSIMNKPTGNRSTLLSSAPSTCLDSKGSCAPWESGQIKCNRDLNQPYFLVRKHYWHNGLWKRGFLQAQKSKTHISLPNLTVLLHFRVLLFSWNNTVLQKHFWFWFTFLYLSHCSVLPKNIVKKNSKCCKWYLASLWSVTQFYLSHHVYIMFAKLCVGKYSILVAIRLDGSHLCGSNTLLIWNWIWKQVKVQIAFLLTTVCMDQSNDCNNSVWVHVCASVL